MNSVSKHVTIATMNRPNKLNVSIDIFPIIKKKHGCLTFTVHAEFL